MNEKKLNRMKNLIHELNNSELSTPIIIKKLDELNTQTNYNPLLNEWHGKKELVTVVETNGIIEAFKESEVWKENGTISVHDYKCIINDNLNIDLDEISTYIVERLDNNNHYEIVFYREYIGEIHIGLRPVTRNAV